MSGTEYVIEQLGQALQNAHAVIAQQATRIADLQAQIAEVQGGPTAGPGQ